MIAEWITCLDKRSFERTGEDLDIIYARLKSVKAFEKVHPALLQQICLYGCYEELDEGVTLYCQGDIGTNWYAVLSGSLDVNVSNTGDPKDEVTICTLGTGTVFGDSVLTNSPRRATVVTSEYSELLRISAPHFREMWQKHRQYMGALITDSELQLLTSGHGANALPPGQIDGSGAPMESNNQGFLGAGMGAVVSDSNALVSPQFVGFNNDVNVSGSTALGASGFGGGRDQFSFGAGTSVASGGGAMGINGRSIAMGQGVGGQAGLSPQQQHQNSLRREEQGGGFGHRGPFSLQDHSPEMSVKMGSQPWEAWTSRPSEKMAQAGRVLRILMLSSSGPGMLPGQPSLIRDRKLANNTYRRCAIGSEMVEWLMAQNNHIVHSRHHAMGMWQALLEEGVLIHVNRDREFRDDPNLYYRFLEDEMPGAFPSQATGIGGSGAGVGAGGGAGGLGTMQPTAQDKRDAEEFLPEILTYLSQTGPDAIFRLILRKPGHTRSAEEVELLYDELLHIKALSHLSTMVKRELAGVITFEAHPKAGFLLFRQGDEGRSWFIILSGSVDVVTDRGGVVCTLHEGDDFGKLALVNTAPRAASVIVKCDNSHFLKVLKEDFLRILQDVEKNTVRLKEGEQDVLVLEKIAVKLQHHNGVVSATIGTAASAAHHAANNSQPGASTSAQHNPIQYRYSIMAGTSEKMLDYLLETRLDANADLVGDTFLEDFLLTYPVFLSNSKLTSMLTRHYTTLPLQSVSASSTSSMGGGLGSSNGGATGGEADGMFQKKRKVIHFVLRWCVMALHEFTEDPSLISFLNELCNSCANDVKSYPLLKNELHALEQAKAGKITYYDYRKQNRSYVMTQGRRSEEHHPEKRKSIRGPDENIFKVYCFDHTYTTLRLPMDTKAEVIATQAASKLCLEDEMLLYEVKSTGERIPFKKNDVSVTSALSINGRLFVASRDHVDKLCPLPDQEGPQCGTSVQLEMMSSKEIAYQLTILEYELFSCIHEYEFIYHTFGRHNFGKITANLDIFLRRFHEVQYWVITELVLCQNLTKRIAILRKFIKVAQYCKEYQNLDTFYAVVMGLNNVAVSRLRETWEKLPMKLRKMSHEFENMLDPCRNHRLYRLALARMNPPIIPFLPLLMKDMLFTHEGNRTYFDGLVNFEKMHMVASTIRHIQHCRSEVFNFEPPGTSRNIQEIRSYVRNLKVIDNQRLLTQLSHRLEPRS